MDAESPQSTTREGLYFINIFPSKKVLDDHVSQIHSGTKRRWPIDESCGPVVHFQTSLTSCSYGQRYIPHLADSFFCAHSGCKVGWRRISLLLANGHKEPIALLTISKNTWWENHRKIKEIFIYKKRQCYQ
jgi:hypothetical protein